MSAVVRMFVVLGAYLHSCHWQTLSVLGFSSMSILGELTTAMLALIQLLILSGMTAW